MADLVILTILIIFITGLFRTIFGFGAGLIAMPLLLMFIPIRVASPLVTVISLVIAAFLLYRDYKTIDLRKARKLIIPGLFGIPIGLFLLQDKYASNVTIFLGIVIILFAIFKLYNPYHFTLKTERFAPIFGFISGILGGAYNVEGPPIIIYCTMRKYHPTEFKTYLQAVFLPLNIVILVGHIISGNFSELTLNLLMYSIPVLLVSIFIGIRLFKKIPVDKFIRTVYVLLIILGSALIYKHL